MFSIHLNSYLKREKKKMIITKWQEVKLVDSIDVGSPAGLLSNRRVRSFPHSSSSSIVNPSIYTTISRISRTCSFSLRGTGFDWHHRSCRLFAANASNWSRPTRTSARDRGIPSSLITTSRISPKSAESGFSEWACKRSETIGSWRRKSRTRACWSRLALYFALYLHTAGRRIQLVSPWPTPRGPSWDPELAI